MRAGSRASESSITTASFREEIALNGHLYYSDSQRHCFQEVLEEQRAEPQIHVWRRVEHTFSWKENLSQVNLGTWVPCTERALQNAIILLAPQPFLLFGGLFPVIGLCSARKPPEVCVRRALPPIQQVPSGA